MSSGRKREPEAPLSPRGFEPLLAESARQLDFEVPKAVRSPLAGYLSELDIWRRKLNLTGQLETRELVEHALESVLGASLIPHSARVADVGSGAGFPGLPLAISRKDLDVTLVEPRERRCAFLRHVIRVLDLDNVAVLQERIEEVGGQTFDVATTRAVGRFGDWLRKPRFLKHGGLLVAWLTNAGGAESSLDGGFKLERSLPVPGSLRKEIAVFRRLS